MKNFSLSMYGETLRQLASELLVPALCAALATAYQYSSAAGGWTAAWQAKTGFEHASAYFLKLFFFGAFFAYFLRAMKTVRDRRNHDSVIEKQKAVLTRLEALSADLSGYTTGGDGFCFVWFVQVVGGHIVSLDIALEGRFALREVTIGVTGLKSSQQRLQTTLATGNVAHSLQSDHNFRLPVVVPNQITALSCHIPLDGVVSRFWIRWHAANGSWTQQLEIDLRGSSGMAVRARVHKQDNSKFVSPEGTSQEDEAWKWE